MWRIRGSIASIREPDVRPSAQVADADWGNGVYYSLHGTGGHPIFGRPSPLPLSTVRSGWAFDQSFPHCRAFHGSSPLGNQSGTNGPQIDTRFRACARKNSGSRLPPSRGRAPQRRRLFREGAPASRASRPRDLCPPDVCPARSWRRQNRSGERSVRRG